MSANELLLWMSARRQGSWQQFRAAVEELHLGEENEINGEDDDTPDQFALPLYHTLRFNLQRVGHVEFFAGAGEGAQWRVTPPTLAVTQHLRGCLGIVVGARSPLLLQRVRAAIGRANLQTLVLPAYPDQLLIDANDPSMLAEVATRANLSLQSDAPAALLTSLPPVDDPCVRRATELPFGAGWRIDKFSPDDLVWRSATLNDIKIASGSLFRFALRHQRQVLYCARGAAFQIPGQVGKYLVLKKSRHQVLRYDRHHCSLAVPASSERVNDFETPG